MVPGQGFVSKTIGEYQHAVCVVRTDGGWGFVPAISKIRGDNQVVALLPDDALDTVQEGDEEVITQVVEQKSDDACLAACQVPGRCVRREAQVAHDLVQSLC